MKVLRIQGLINLHTSSVIKKTKIIHIFKKRWITYAKIKETILRIKTITKSFKTCELQTKMTMTLK